MQNPGCPAGGLVGRADLFGVLAGITAALAAASVSVFCVSTFDTDYVLVKETSLKTAVTALQNAGYVVD